MFIRHWCIIIIIIVMTCSVYNEEILLFDLFVFSGSRSSGLGRCRAMGLTKRKFINSLKPDSKQTSAATATLFSYFEFDRRKRPK